MVVLKFVILQTSGMSCILVTLLPMDDFVVSSIGHLENTGSLIFKFLAQYLKIIFGNSKTDLLRKES